MKFVLPLKVAQSGKTDFPCNMNRYRNLNGFALNKVKVEFSRIFGEKYGHVPGLPLKSCQLEYTVFFADNTITDLGNVCSVLDKFASDCLVKYGYIEDDNRRILKRITFIDGGIDRQNPRAELELIEMKEE